MSLWVWCALGGAGAAGAVVRYLVDSMIAVRLEGRVRGGFPWGTLLVNLTGSLVLGVISGLALYHALPATPKILMGAGFCGAYTTFSTFALETVLLAREGERMAAALNAFANVVGGCLAAGIGLALASL